jgi:hypothetical protein
MVKRTRKNGRSRVRSIVRSKKRLTRKNNMVGAGYTMPHGYYNAPGFPTLVNPFASVPSTAATSSMIRPELIKQGGGSRKLKGGFSPSVMGAFIPNAQAAIKEV